MTNAANTFLMIALTALLSACSGATSPPAGTGASNAERRPSLDQPFVEAGTGSALGSDQERALDGLARGASAGTLLARSGDGATCIFANGREGWNPAAC